MKSTPSSDTRLKFIVVFLKIVMTFLGRNTSSSKFLDITNKKDYQNHVAP